MQLDNKKFNDQIRKTHNAEKWFFISKILTSKLVMFDIVFSLYRTSDTILSGKTRSTAYVKNEKHISKIETCKTFQ